MLCEKPLGVAVEEVEDLRRDVRDSGRVLQVGHMKRFDAGVESAKAFIEAEMGELLALKAWYCNSTHRYQLTDAVQPAIIKSAGAKRPAGNPKADLGRYFMFAHGSHLVDTARYLGGEIVEVDARRRERFGAYCWFVDVTFASGALGHLDLTVPVRMDWHEGFQIYGENGSVLGRTYNPWLYKSSDVDIFHEATGETTRLLGADGHFYRRQLEGFAATILDRAPMRGANIEDGVATVRGMVAIARSRRSASLSVSPTSRGRCDPVGVFAKTFPDRRRWASSKPRARPAMRPFSTTWPVPAYRRCPWPSTPQPPTPCARPRARPASTSPPSRRPTT